MSGNRPLHGNNCSLCVESITIYLWSMYATSDVSLFFTWVAFSRVHTTSRSHQFSVIDFTRNCVFLTNLRFQCQCRLLDLVTPIFSLSCLVTSYQDYDRAGNYYQQCFSFDPHLCSHLRRLGGILLTVNIETLFLQFSMWVDWWLMDKHSTRVKWSKILVRIPKAIPLQVGKLARGHEPVHDSWNPL